MRKSPSGAVVSNGTEAGEVEKGRFSSKELEAAKMVSPGAEGGSSSEAGMRCRAPKPSVQPKAPWPPQLRDGVISTGLVTSYS
jgi:hypothetical protein